MKTQVGKITEIKNTSLELTREATTVFKKVFLKTFKLPPQSTNQTTPNDLLIRTSILIRIQIRIIRIIIRRRVIVIKRIIKSKRKVGLVPC